MFPAFSTVAGATGSNVTMTVQASPDNTNWTTVGIAACTLANNGTNSVMGCVQLNPTNLANTPWIRIGTWQHVNATNGVAGSRALCDRGHSALTPCGPRMRDQLYIEPGRGRISPAGPFRARKRTYANYANYHEL